MYAIGIDPGDEYVGVCVAEQDDSQYGWTVITAVEMTPDQATSWYVKHLPGAALVAVEKFTLYPDKLREQIGSEMKTSQLIGFFKYYAAMFPSIDFVSYPAAVQKPTIGLLKYLKIKPVSKSDHHHNARSAELQLYCALSRAGLMTGVTLS